jgi:hypothetical protein
MASSPKFTVSEGEDFEIEICSRLDKSNRKTLVKFDGTLGKAIFPSGGIQVGTSGDAFGDADCLVISAALAKAPNAAGATLVTDVSAANGAQVIAAQPDVPRKLFVFITDANSSITAGNLVLVGIDASGAAIRETITLTGGTATKTTVNAFAILTSATIDSLAGAAGADHVAIGVGDALGLPVRAGAVLSVFKEAVGATVASTPVNETVGTVDSVARTVIPTTATDGTKCLWLWYSYTC